MKRKPGWKKRHFMWLKKNVPYLVKEPVGVSLETIMAELKKARNHECK